jgi:carboxylesterase type B
LQDTSTWKSPTGESLGQITVNQSEAYIKTRIETALGDLSRNAAHRFFCRKYSSLATCYSFRFDATPSDSDVNGGAYHGSEIGPVFQNLLGVGFGQNPFQGKGRGYHDMARLIGTMWASFISDLDPNAAVRDETDKLLWPKYTANRPSNFVFSEYGSWVEEDTYRTRAMDYINEMQHTVLDK